jgi:hypothetical protein
MDHFNQMKGELKAQLAQDQQLSFQKFQQSLAKQLYRQEPDVTPITGELKIELK